MTNPAPAPIGLFDSGIGGLSVLRHLQGLLPTEPLLYVADQAHVPYGPRPAGQVRAFSEAITRFLLTRGARLIVVACNTATAAALNHLRQRFPGIPFVGMEPAVKPGAAQTRNGRVGVLATVGTFDSQRYASLMARFAGHVTVYEDPCPGLVSLIEAGAVDTPETEALVGRCLAPMLAAGVDTIILGCTHYPFVMPLIRRLAGPEVVVIDPAPAVARQAARLLPDTPAPWADGAVAPAPLLLTTGPVSILEALVPRLLPKTPFVARGLVWEGGDLTSQEPV